MKVARTQIVKDDRDDKKVEPDQPFAEHIQMPCQTENVSAVNRSYASRH